MKAYFVGGGIGSLAGAAFLIRDAKVSGSDITIYERLRVSGGSLDAAHIGNGAYSLRGGRMLTTDAYECTWDLYKGIPSISNPAQSVFEETVAFNEKNKAHSQARLVDKNRHKVDTKSMGFSNHDRIEMLRLVETSEEKLGSSRITDWLSPAFFETHFWYMWQTTFAFQPWHSAVELKRYMIRFINEFPRIDTLGGVKRTVYNQYDALVRPLIRWLEEHKVRFEHEVQVVDVGIEEEDQKVWITSLRCSRNGTLETVGCGKGDLVFIQNGSMTDASTLGSMEKCPASLTKAESGGWVLWEKLAKGRPEFGNPAAFNTSIPESYWESFTVTCKTPEFFDKMEMFTGNKAGTGGLVTFKDSNWLLSVVLYHQPHFIDQAPSTQVFWGYALYPDRVGDFVPKTMSECSGAEILTELCGHLKFDRSMFEKATCIPCRMPYITSMFMPRSKTDRPLPVPKTSGNLAFVSQFVELPDDVVFTVEFSIRAAQTAVYQLMKINRPIPPVTRYDHSFKVLFDSFVKSLS
jgi:oleate hydratase